MSPAFMSMACTKVIAHIAQPMSNLSVTEDVMASRMETHRCDVPRDQVLPLPFTTIDRVLPQFAVIIKNNRCDVPKDQALPLPITTIDSVLPQFAVMIKKQQM